MSFGPIISGLSYLSIGNLTSSIIGGILLLLLATLLPVEQYGQLSFHLSIATILSTISIFGLNIAIITLGAKGNTQFIQEAVSLILLISIGLLIVLSIWYWPLAVIYVGMVYFIASSAILLSLKAYKEYAIVLIASKATQFLLILLFHNYFGIQGVLLCYGLGFLIFSYRYLSMVRRFSLHFPHLIKERTFIFHTSMISFAQSLSASIDKIFIAPLFGFAILANYQLGYQFLLFLSILPGTVFQFLLPYESKNIIVNKRIKAYLVLASGIIAVIFVLVTPLGIHRYLPKYENAIDSIKIMGLGIVPLTIISIAHSHLLTTSKSGSVALGESVYIGAQLVLIYVLGNAFGNIGLAYSMLLSFSIQSIFIMLIVKIKHIIA